MTPKVQRELNELIEEQWSEEFARCEALFLELEAEEAQVAAWKRQIERQS